MKTANKIKCFCVVVLMPLMAKGQGNPPLWIDDDYRSNRFQQELYLVGFSFGDNRKNEEIGEFVRKQADHARALLIQSVISTIKNRTDYAMTATKSTFSDKLESATTSFAEARLTGLEVETYFDEKQKRGYAIAYVKRDGLSAHYQGIIDDAVNKIEQRLAAANEAMKTGKLEVATNQYFSNYPLFPTIDEARIILSAIERDRPSNFSIANQLRQETDKGVAALKDQKGFSLDELSLFLAYSLFSNIDTLKQIVSLKDITYKNTGMNSLLSDRFAQSFEASLAKTGDYHIARESFSMPRQSYSISGTYWDEDGIIRITVILKDSNDASISSADAYIATSWLTRQKITYKPDNLGNIDLLKTIQLEALNPKYEEGIARIEKNPLKVKVQTSDGKALTNVPIKFILAAKKESVAFGTSNEHGIAEGVLSNLTPSNSLRLIHAVVNVPAWLGIEENSKYHQELKEQYKLPSVKFFVKIKGVAVYMEVSETTTSGQTAKVPLISGKVSQELLKRGNVIAGELSEADCMVVLEASARQGSEIYGMYFAFVDASLSIVSLATGEEIFKKVFSSVKEGGASLADAERRAFLTLAPKVITAITTQFDNPDFIRGLSE